MKVCVKFCLKWMAQYATWFFYLAEQLFIKQHGLNWCCLTFVLKQIIKLHIAWCMLLFCSSKPWIKKSYLNFVPVQIKTFIFTSLTIYPSKIHPSICRLISLENTCYSLVLLQALVIFKAADTNLHENSHFTYLLTKRHIQLELSSFCGTEMLQTMAAGFCAFSALHFFAVTLLFLWWLFLLALSWTDHEGPWSVAFTGPCT